MLRTIEEVQPRFVVGENVRGLTNWNGGLVFDEVQFDLETKGYEVIPFLLPACAVNAPHRRDRIWFIAHCNNKIGQREKCNNSGWEDKKPKSYNRNDLRNNIGTTNEREFITDSNKIRLSTKMENGKLERGFRPTKRDERDMWHSFPTQPPICGGNDGIPRELDSITFPKWRNESIKAYGNAIVPQVAYQIFKAIQQYDTNHSQTNG